MMREAVVDQLVRGWQLSGSGKHHHLDVREGSVTATQPQAAALILANARKVVRQLTMPNGESGHRREEL